MIIEVELIEQEVIEFELVEDSIIELDLELGTLIEGDIREHYEGPYIVTPKKDVEQLLETAEKIMDDDVTVLEIPYSETSNPQGGKTVNIAFEL